MSLLRYCRPRILRMIATAPRWSWMKWRTGGMLSPLGYRAIYRAARALPDLPFVEIGAASGSATIAIARGFIDTGRSAPVVAVEKCEGGSRERFGGYDDNLAILERNLQRFGVAGRVRLFTRAIDEQSAPDLLQLVGGDRISGFMHDADGRLDRDFTLFWPLTIDGGLIIVDDFTDDDDIAGLYRAHGISAKKKLMALRAVRVMTAHGLFERETMVGDTLFGRKPSGLEGRAVPVDELRAAVEAARGEYEAHIRAAGPEAR